MPSPPIPCGTAGRAFAGSCTCRPASPPDLLAPIEVDVEILPVGREYRRAEAAQPRLNEVVLETEYCRQHGHVRSRELGHLARGSDLLGSGPAAQKLLGGTVVRGLPLKAGIIGKKDSGLDAHRPAHAAIADFDWRSGGGRRQPRGRLGVVPPVQPLAKPRQ